MSFGLNSLYYDEDIMPRGHKLPPPAAIRVFLIYAFQAKCNLVKFKSAKERNDFRHKTYIRNGLHSAL